VPPVPPRGLGGRLVAVGLRAILRLAEGERNFLVASMGFGE